MLATAAAAFAAAVAGTLHFSLGMPGRMPMPAAAAFVAMWLAMMVAMMLPSALPSLLVYQRVMQARADPGRGLRLWLAGAGYFAVWTAFGVAAYALGRALEGAATAWESAARLAPYVAGAALALAGAWQLTPWKSACLRHCRDPLRLLVPHVDGGARGALAFGLSHGAYCSACCWGIMLGLAVLGAMNLGAMVLAAALIAAEKLLPRGERVAQAAGIAAIAAGLWLAARALS